MKIGELIDIMSCTSGYELIAKTSDALERMGISVLKEDGSFKGLDDILVYSGYTINELKEKEDEDVWYCLNNIAALIDGPYEQLLDDGKGIRGSSNQNVYIYKYYDRHKRILTVDRKQQCIKLENKLIFIGLPKEK